MMQFAEDNMRNEIFTKKVKNVSFFENKTKKNEMRKKHLNV